MLKKSSLKELLTIQDMARLCKCVDRTIRRRKANNTIPSPDIKEGNFVRWFPETFKNWKRKNATKK